MAADFCAGHPSGGERRPPRRWPPTSAPWTPLLSATEEELTAIADVGPITAGYIRQWVESPQSRDLLERRLRAAGVNMTCREEQTDRRFAGMTFVLTGALEKFTREEAGEMIERRG